MKKPLVLAYYLPQYHPFPENDEWWGKGFTEWTNVAKAKRLYPGHYQPRIPSDLGFYDLRVSETREEQANLAREAGVDGFCYWHYWFNGKKMMERPFEEVVASGKPDFPFCLNWANHSWYAKTWNKDIPDKLLIEQTYGGDADYINHFNYLLESFRDSRYIKVDGKILFGIYDYKNFPNISHFFKLWNKLAQEQGLKGFHFFGLTFKESEIETMKALGFDTIIIDYAFLRQSAMRYAYLFAHKLHLCPQLIEYNDYAKTYLKNYHEIPNVCPNIVPDFDHTPRSGMRGSVMLHASPENFCKLVDGLFEKINTFNETPEILMIKSWNEWGEGNYMEPDRKFGKGYIEALRHALDKHFD